ncbi:MAG: hypothetical protein N2V77_02110 [Canidatus Methanoxibalbensis ujae]|nr:hypothetical protein [Candidatus Methanoxibalbensis ujae]
MAKICIEGESLSDVRRMLGEEPTIPSHLESVVNDVVKVLEAARRAREEDPRGRSKRMIARYAGIDDVAMVSDILQLLAHHKLVEKRTKGRWVAVV